MPKGDLLLYNARVLTMSPARPVVEAVAVRAGHIVAAGTADEARAAAPGDAVVLDAEGRTVVPGFVDAHLHLAALAATHVGVDCSRASVRSIDELVRRIAERARETPRGEWVRAFGYDEDVLAEGRHPTRWDLDRAAPHHPVRLVHRSGHAAVLNSLALALAGITIASEEPPGAVIDRRLDDGEPNGLLLEMNDIVGQYVPPLPRDDLVRGLRAADEQLLAAGVTAVQDMTHTNGRSAHDFLTELATDAGFVPTLLPTAVGWTDMDSPTLDERNEHQSQPAKLMIREASGTTVPTRDEITALVRLCVKRGRQLAVHAVERATVAMVVDAFERAGEGPALAALRCRIEHAGVCPPALCARIAALGLVVVSNPAFVWYGGERYRRTVAPDSLPHLYDGASLRRAGVRVAAGSDAPVYAPQPLAGIRAATGRRTADGARLPGDGVPAETALAMHTAEAAYAARVEQAHGGIAPGRRADLVVLSSAPAAMDTSVVATITGGRVRFGAGHARLTAPAREVPDRYG